MPNRSFPNEGLRKKPEPPSTTKLPGGASRPYFWGSYLDREGTMGAKTGTLTRESGSDDLRAMTPQEVQQRTSEVDAEDLRSKTKGVAGAMPSYRAGGVVAKTGLAMVHAGETIIPVKSEACKQIAVNAGWLVRNQDPRDSGYTGDNAPWRK